MFKLVVVYRCIYFLLDHHACQFPFSVISCMSCTLLHHGRLHMCITAWTKCDIPTLTLVRTTVYINQALKKLHKFKKILSQMNQSDIHQYYFQVLQLFIGFHLLISNRDNHTTLSFIVVAYYCFHYGSVNIAPPYHFFYFMFCYACTWACAIILNFGVSVLSDKDLVTIL